MLEWQTTIIMVKHPHPEEMQGMVKERRQQTVQTTHHLQVINLVQHQMGIMGIRTSQLPTGDKEHTPLPSQTGRTTCKPTVL